MKIMFRYGWAVISLVLCAVLAGGCGSDTSVLISDKAIGEPERVGTSGVRESEAVTGDGEIISEEWSEKKEHEEENGTERTEKPGSAGQDIDAENARQPKMIYVDVQGAVKAPGVYQLPEGSRVFQAIEMAGGISGEAAVEFVNQAGVLEDGQQIRIYTREEAEELQKEKKLIDESGSPAKEAEKLTDSRVNINRADKTALMTLTGIGETRAEAILDYREEHGGFASVEELMQVDGIKGKTYEKLKDQITVD